MYNWWIIGNDTHYLEYGTNYRAVVKVDSGGYVEGTLLWADAYDIETLEKFGGWGYDPEAVKVQIECYLDNLLDN